MSFRHPAKTKINSYFNPVRSSDRCDRCLGRFLGNLSSFLANSEPSPTRNQEVQSGVEEPTLKQGQPDHSTIPVISSSEVCTDSESDDGEDLTTARGLQEYKRWRTRRPNKTTQSLRRKPYGNDGTTRNLRHDYCTMPGQRIIQDEKLVRDTLLKVVWLLCTWFQGCAKRLFELLARDFKKLSDHDERLQPHLSLPNSPPIEVCQEAFRLVYVASPEIKLADQFITYHMEPSGERCRKIDSYHRLLSIIQELTFRVSQSEDQFGRCTDCGELNTMIRFAETPEKKKSAMEPRDLHDKMVDIYHAWYIMDKAFCERHPDKKSCIAVDPTTLEQGIPSHHPPKKLFDRKSKLEVNFGGGIQLLHFSGESHQILFCAFFSFHQGCKSCSHSTIFMIWAQLTSDFAASRSAELRWLLLLLLFKKVFLTFLPVGHTGNEVDSSVFGSVKDKCKVSDIVCLFDIFKVAKEGLTKPNQLIYPRSVLDFRSFFQPHLLGIQRTMEGRYFEFQLSYSRRSDGSRFPVVRGKKYLNELAEFGE
eukprot:g41998.t1